MFLVLAHGYLSADSCFAALMCNSRCAAIEFSMPPKIPRDPKDLDFQTQST